MSVERELGEHNKAIERLEEDVRQMREDLAAIKDLLASARGGWKSLMWVAGFASAAGAALLKLAELLSHLGQPPH